MTNLEKINLALPFIDSLFPNAKCELFYSKDYELAIAVMLSAQTTDKAVNKATEKLFKDFPTLESFANGKLEDIEKDIQFLGLFKNKAKNIKDLAVMLLKDFDGKLPSDKDDLQKLPGIGNKSAGVIRCEVFKIPDLPVDTHIIRITNRLGIANSKDEPIDIERKLKKIIPEDRWIKTHHQLIHFGRYFCTSKNPQCEHCGLKDICKYQKYIFSIASMYLSLGLKAFSISTPLSWKQDSGIDFLSPCSQKSITYFASSRQTLSRASN